MLGERVRRIRLDLGWSTEKMASKIGLSQESVSNWEAGRTKIPLERLRKFSEVTGFPMSYILGEKMPQSDWAKPLAKEALGMMHRKPVWTRSHGWGLVNFATKSIILTDGRAIAFSDLHEDLFAIPPAFSISIGGFGRPLTVGEISKHESVWLEPIGADTDLNAEVRGWYHPFKDIYVANEFGIRFYLDTYWAKWLAFAEEV